VRLYLPRASASLAETPDPYHDTAAASESHGLRVLLVEDNEEVAAGTEALLSMMNHDVTHIFNADGAIAMLEAARRDVSNGGLLPFDVVLSDIHMPGKLNGIDLAEILQSWTPRVPVILVTGYAEELDRARGVDARVLSKPFDIALLDSLLQGIRENLSAHGEAQH
jgi:CheY-like chemotaxis protein